ncbi:MAG: hypothetical protein Q8R74_01545 [Methylophilus sp.]|nr:hypothetical protein [Methylophilus sp.]
MNTLVEKVQRLAKSKVASWILLIGFFYMVAAAAHSGSMAKYALRDGNPAFSIIQMMDGTAERPFVYRQLLPTIAKIAQKTISESESFFYSAIKKVKLDASQNYTRATDANVEGYQYGYKIVYLASFLGLFLSLIMLRALLLSQGYGQVESVLAPTAFIIAFPYLQSIGGFFYDSIELAFFIGAIMLAYKGRIASLIVLTIFASFNKESFLFFIPTFYPFIRAKFTFKQTILIFISLLSVSTLIHFYLHELFKGNVGSEMYFHLWINLKEYLSPMTYLRNETTYGLPGPSGFFITTLTIMLIVAVRAKLEVSLVWKQHFLIAFLINMPLFLAFCVTGELRNLSMLYVGAVIFMAGALRASLKNSTCIR